MPKPIVRPWLNATSHSTPSTTYQHTAFAETSAMWSNISSSIQAYFHAAHGDADRRLRKVLGLSLDPLGRPQGLPPPYDGYPCALPQVTLQGYFGEVLAGLLVEAEGAAGLNDWEIPAHLFHTHILAFQQLENAAQLGVRVGTMVGRTGDDCLAFRRDQAGHIIELLYCEAKCTTTHDAGLIADAHEKAATAGVVDLLQLVDALLSRGTPDDIRWADCIRLLHSQIHASPGAVIRRNLVCYVHGQKPVRGSSWISATSPHAKYTSPQTLHSIEVHLDDVRATLYAVYNAQTWR